MDSHRGPELRWYSIDSGNYVITSLNFLITLELLSACIGTLIIANTIPTYDKINREHQIVAISIQKTFR